MSDAVLSAAAARIIALLEEQSRYHVNLVRGAEKEVRSMAKELKIIRNVLDDTENRRFYDKNINFWLSRLEQTSSQMEDVLDEWNYAILKLKLEEHHQSDDDIVEKKVCSFIPSCSCLCFKKAVFRHDIAKKIISLKAQLDEVLEEKDRYKFLVSQPPTSLDPLPDPSRIQTTSFIDLEKVHGRDGDRDFLVRKVLDEGVSQGESSGIPVLSIVGVGGLGKTTLAQQVYNDAQVEKLFGEFRIWVCVSDPFDPATVAKGILENIDGGSPITNQLHVLLKHVTESLAGKKFLLVLDDVWTEDDNRWESIRSSLRCGGTGSKILVTTRNERVGRMMGSRETEICRPRLLSNEDCWSLLSCVALSERNENEFKDIGMKIAQKCNGLPLAVKTLGSLLRCKRNLQEWEKVLYSEIWEIEEAELDLFPHLLLSYKDLSPTLKHCFSYCAIYPKDFKINVESLIGDWMALGYLGSDECDMELKGRNCFDALAMRSLFQDIEKNLMDDFVESCKMHDIVHDFAQFIRKNGRIGDVPEMNKAACGVCDPPLVSKVNEFCSLDYKEEYHSKSCGCMVRLRVLSLEKQSIPQGMVRLIHLRSLKLFWIDNISYGDLRNIFQLYHLQTLICRGCNLDKIPREIKNLIHLWKLELSENEALEELPKEIVKLINLRHLNLKKNKSLNKLPKQIGELINLRHLDLGENESLKELPISIGNLIELRCLNLWECGSLKNLPESIGGFRELQVLIAVGCESLSKFPEGLGQSTSLHFLGGFKGGSGGSKMTILKKLNNLGGALWLSIKLDGDVLEEGGIVEDAGEAELRTKIHLNKLVIIFEDRISNERSSSLINSVRMDMLGALQPHPDLRELYIEGYKGSKLPIGWMVSPLNRLKRLELFRFPKLTSLPPFGRLPCLEDLNICIMLSLETVGAEFNAIVGEDEMRLNVQSASLNTNTNLHTVSFPKLKTLQFVNCPRWNEWEDIRAAAEVSCMPSLIFLKISSCPALTALPHNLLQKASSLQTIEIEDSPHLAQRYMDKEGPQWKSISRHNPNLQLEIHV